LEASLHELQDLGLMQTG